MAKFVSVPVEETPAEPAEAWLLQDPAVQQGLAIMILAALATVFIALLLRSLMRTDRKPRGKAAALTGADYSGQGFGAKTSKANAKSKLRGR